MQIKRDLWALNWQEAELESYSVEKSEFQARSPKAKQRSLKKYSLGT
jgi:hypothetical protein